MPTTTLDETRPGRRRHTRRRPVQPPYRPRDAARTSVADHSLQAGVATFEPTMPSRSDLEPCAVCARTRRIERRAAAVGRRLLATTMCAALAFFTASRAEVSLQARQPTGTVVAPVTKPGAVSFECTSWDAASSLLGSPRCAAVAN